MRRGVNKQVHFQLKEKMNFWETRNGSVRLSLGLRFPMYIYMHI